MSEIHGIVLQLSGDEALECIRMLEALNNSALFTKIEKGTYSIWSPPGFLPETLSALATLGLPFFFEEKGRAKGHVFIRHENDPKI